MVIYTNVVTLEELDGAIQRAKDAGQKILALSPSKIRMGVVKEYVLVVGEGK